MAGGPAGLQGESRASLEKRRHGGGVPRELGGGGHSLGATRGDLQEADSSSLISSGVPGVDSCRGPSATGSSGLNEECSSTSGTWACQPAQGHAVTDPTAPRSYDP